MDTINKIFQIGESGIYSSPSNHGVMWSPLIFLIVTLVIALVIWLFGKFFFNNKYNKNSGQTKTYYSGSLENIDYNIQAENLYWGFKVALKSYYKVIKSMHTGDITDYVKWLIISISSILLLINGGLL